MIELQDDLTYPVWVGRGTKRIVEMSGEEIKRRSPGKTLQERIAELEAMLKRPDCNSCANRGKIYGLTQETYCDHCQWSQWLNNNFFVQKEGEK